MSAYLSPYIWASETDYPGGANPWNGQPLVVLPSQDYFTPNTKPPAEWFNWLFKQTSLQFQFLYSQVASCAPLNWRPQFITSGFASPIQEAGAWDPIQRVYVLGMVTVTGTPLVQVWTSLGMDQGTAANWMQLGTNYLTTNGWLYLTVSPDPATASVPWIAGTDNAATHNNCVIAHFASGSWSFGTIAAAGYFYGIESAVIGVAVCFAVAGTGAGDSQILSRNTGGLTLSFNTGLTMAAGSTWCIKSNGTQVVAIPSSVGLYTVFYSADGQTWQASSSLAGLLAAGNTVVGLAWGADALGRCWLAAIQSVSGQPFWARSADGITWTIQAGGVSTNLTVTDMAAVGTALVCTLADSTPAGPSYSIYSIDGGITWFPCPLYFSSNDTAGSTPGYKASSLVASDIGFMAFNSLWVRFSENQWVPALQL